ncbi:GNAT family N-acetyltransferase [Streptosporangium sp. NPDC048047]|uniref:GNAT family N-acetyltransferase n=1 Tax=Streptosporangium sp. NPDC048047 TaxID=3155748 RepID=UPI00341F5D46
MTTLPITVTPYTPGAPGLDAQLAWVGYMAMFGWPDQRPVTARLVRSRLRPQGGGATTTLLLARTPDGELAAAAALRYPAAPGLPARLWGPAVHPSMQQRGLGTALVQRALAAVDDPAMIVRTAEIPAVRRHACTFFEKIGWEVHSTAALLKAPTGAAWPVPGVRPLTADQAPALAELYHAVCPEHGWGVAADTYSRWSADERFIGDGLLVAEDAGRLQAAVLVYPLAHSHPGEAPEALLADVLIHPGADFAALARRMITAGLGAGARAGARVARAVIPAGSPLLAELRAAGFADLDEICYYQAPIPIPR